MTRTVNATPEQVFDLLVDPRKHVLIDGSQTIMASRRDAPRRLSLGARFTMDMRIGLPYKITNTVVEFEEGRLIAWRHLGRHRWRWELAPEGEGTRVTETFDYSSVPHALFYELVNYPARNKEAIERTLDRLAERFPG